MKTKFIIKPKIWRIIFYLILIIVVFNSPDNYFQIGDYNLRIGLLIFFLLMFSFQFISYLFPKRIELKEKYLEYKFLFNQKILHYDNIKVFLRKNFFSKLYLITDNKKQNKIPIFEASDEFIEEFEEALEIKLIENNIT